MNQIFILKAREKKQRVRVLFLNLEKAYKRTIKRSNIADTKNVWCEWLTIKWCF